MVQFKPPPGFHSDPIILLVDEDTCGAWQVHENHGRVDARFENREAAVRFAETVRARLPGSYLMVTPRHMVPFPERVRRAG